nr:MAG TPA: Minor structural protein 4 [Caudoviricetes sp.]
MKVFLFNNDEKLIGTVSPLEGIQNEEINKIQTIECTVVYSELIEKASYIGHKDYSDNRIFHLYKIDHVTKTSTTDVKIVGVHTFFDDMESDGYVKDFRPTNRELVGVLTTILDGSRWQLGTVNIQRRYTGNFYYVTRKEAISKLIEATQIEIKPRLEFSRGKITGRYLDVFTRLGARNGKVFVHGRDLLTVSEKKSQGAIYTAVVGRGKGEETDTGGYGRRISFKDVEWRRTSGQPVDKPVGQEYVEIPAMTKLYGFEKGTKPRIKIVEFQDEADKEKLLRLSYEWLEKNSRMQVEYSAKVLNVGNLELGDTVGIFNPKLGIKYETRVFKVKRNLVDNKLTEFGIGDKVTTSPFSRTIELAKEMKNFQDDTVYWLDKIRERLSDKLINEDGYNYDLKADNEYKVPAGYYSFDKPIDQNPTKVVYMGAGKIAIANSKKPTGEWNWRTFLDGNGATLDLINTGVLRAGRIQSADGRSYWDLDTGEFHMEQSAINEAVKTVVNGKVQEIVGDIKKNLPTKEELKGKSSYIHKKYSDFADGRNMSDNSTLKYIGIYTGDKQQAPTNASEYSWTKIKSDGKLYKAYSNSLNGLDFTLVEPDENAKLLAKNRPRVNIVNDNDISDIWQANMFLSFKPNTKYTLTARAKGNSNKLWAYFRNNKTSEEYNWGQLEFRGLETKSVTFTTTNDVEGVLFKFVLVPEDEDWTGIQIDWFTIYEGDKRYSDYPTNEPVQYHKYRYFGYVFKESTPVASDFEWFDLQQTSITNDKYTHIVYSDNADGSNFGREPKKYMGVARTTSPTQPTDKTAYKWFKMKGEDGERGRDGVDGKSINENLVPNSNFVKELENWEMPRLINSGLNYQKGHAIQHFGRGYHFWGTPNGNDKGLGTVPFNFIAKQGEKITLSMDLGKDALNNYSTLYLGIHYLGDDNSLKGQQWQELDLTAQNFEVKKYKRISRTFTVGSDMRKCRVMIHCKPQQPANFYIDNIKLERGDTATEWCPAYEDLQGRDGRNGDSYTRNYLSGTADEKILLAINDNFDIQEAFKLVDNKNFRDLGFKNGDKVTFIADYEVLTNGSNKKISKLNFEWHDDTKYRVWMSQDVNPTKGTYVRTLTMNNDLLDCKRARFRADNVNAKIKITNARVIQGDTVQPWSIAQEDLQAHSLTANLRFEGTYINNITNNVRPYLDVFYDGQKVSSGFNAQVKYKGGNRTDWSGFWNVNFDSNGRITNLDWGNREQNGTPLEVIVLVTYKDSNTIANARLDNLPDPTEIKEITKKYKTFESTIDRFNSTIGEVKQQVLANEEKRNLVLGSRMISESDYNKIGGSIDLTLQQAYEGLPYLSLQQNGKTSRVWQGVGFNLSINRINKGETYSIKIPIFISDTIRPDEGAYLEIKNHDTGEILWQSKLDKNTYPIGVWHTHEYTFTASKDMKISKNSFWIYIVKNGFLAFAKPYMCAGSSLPKNYSPAPEDVYLINERVESKILQIKNEINLAVEENIKRATIPTDNLYLSEYGGASDKYFETRENLKANEFYTFVFNANGTSETATGRIYKGINRIGESNFRISINNGLNAFLVKYPSERSKGEGINLDNIPNGVNISDVKIFKGNFLSYFKEDVTKAEIKILKNKIENAVTEGDFGTKLTQNANSLRLAWNNISEYVQFENGGLNIYNGEISEYQLRSRFDQDGNTFYRNGYTVGYIGTVALKDRSNDYGLTFNLEHNATYMAWAYRTKNNDNPDLIWYYTQKSISAYTEANTLNAGCDLNMQNNKLKNTQILNSSFSDSTATSTSLKFTDGQTVTSGWFVLPTSIDDDGNVRGWADKCFLAFRNGILVNYSLP